MLSTQHHAAASRADHGLLLFEEEPSLVHTVGPFVLDALSSGGTALVMATRAHRHRIEDWIRFSGLELPVLEAQGRLLTLDVEQVMARLGGGQDDPEAFAGLLDALVSRVPADAGPVHAFGEVAAALWDEGRITAALEVEEVWRRLIERTSFSVLCAYPAQAMGGLQREGISHCHTHLVDRRDSAAPDLPEASGEVVLRRAFPGGPLACRAARREAVSSLRLVADDPTTRPEEDPLADDVAMVVSELATNAVRHADSAFTLTVTSTPGGLHLAVSDGDDRSGADELPVDETRGLGIVSALAGEWGVDLQPGTKTVWALLPA